MTKKNKIEVGGRVGAIVANGQFDSNCTILDVKTRLFRSPKYLVKYTMNVRGSKGEVLEFMGEKFPIAGSAPYKQYRTEWVNKVWEIAEDD